MVSYRLDVASERETYVYVCVYVCVYGCECMLHVDDVRWLSDRTNSSGTRRLWRLRRELLLISMAQSFPRQILQKFHGAFCQFPRLTAESCPNSAASHGIPLKSKLYQLQPSCWRVRCTNLLLQNIIHFICRKAVMQVQVIKCRWKRSISCHSVSYLHLFLGHYQNTLTKFKI